MPLVLVRAYAQSWGLEQHFCTGGCSAAGKTKTLSLSAPTRVRQTKQTSIRQLAGLRVLRCSPDLEIGNSHQQWLTRLRHPHHGHRRRQHLSTGCSGMTVSAGLLRGSPPKP